MKMENKVVWELLDSSSKMRGVIKFLKLGKICC